MLGLTVCATTPGFYVLILLNQITYSRAAWPARCEEGRGEDSLWELVLFFHSVGPKDHTQAVSVGLGCKNLHLLSPVAFDTQ